MQKQPKKQEVIQKSREYFKTLINDAKPRAFILTTSLTSNPFLKGKDGFRWLNSQLKDYNSRVQKGEVSDTYEMVSYQKMHSMLSDLAQIQTSEDQITTLQAMCEWFKQQQRLVQQRYDQGYIRYEMSKQYRDALKYLPQKEVEVEEKQLDIPFYMIQRIIEPFRRHHRTLHNQLENPARKLQQYKHKTINITSFADQKEELQHPRVLYPMPPKYQPPKEEPEPIQGQPAEGAQQPQPAEGQKIEGAPPPAQEVVPDQPGMDLGLGEQPQEPDEDQPQQDVPDKLRPKNPIYVDAVSKDQEKKYKKGYMFNMANDTKEERNMDLRYLQKYADILRKQKEDTNQIQVAHDWAKRKARITKDFQKKLQEMKFKPQFSFTKEPPPPQERIAYQDQLKFGFTTVVRARTKTNEVDFTLPELQNAPHFAVEEKSMRRDRLSSLRNKFAKILNLGQQEERESAPSLCQYTSRRRGFSEIIRNHSHSRERLIQLQEVGKIKQRLTKVKVNVNIKALSRGLCLPEDEDIHSETARAFPIKQLPSNPDMVETKKKKKKK